MIACHGASSSAPIPPIAMKTYCQPNACVIQPVSGANKTVEKYWAEWKTAAAVPRSADGTQAATIRVLPGMVGASAAPNSRRSANNTNTAVAPEKWSMRPCRNVTADHTKRLSA
jgi:hypothetical protein